MLIKGEVSCIKFIDKSEVPHPWLCWDTDVVTPASKEAKEE